MRKSNVTKDSVCEGLENRHRLGNFKLLLSKCITKLLAETNKFFIAFNEKLYIAIVQTGLFFSFDLFHYYTYFHFYFIYLV